MCQAIGTLPSEVGRRLVNARILFLVTSLLEGLAPQFKFGFIHARSFLGVASLHIKNGFTAVVSVSLLSAKAPLASVEGCFESIATNTWIISGGSATERKCSGF